MTEIDKIIRFAKSIHMKWDGLVIKNYLDKNSLIKKNNNINFSNINEFLLSLEAYFEKDLTDLFLRNGFIHPTKIEESKKINLSKKINIPIDNKEFSSEDIDGAKTLITNEMLIDGTIKLLKKIPKIKGVIGCPRSGMIPASIISTSLSVPLYSISDNKLVKLNGRSDHGGMRMYGFKEEESLPLLVIDDTIHSGRALENVKKTLYQYHKEKFIYASVFVYCDSKKMVDFYFKGLSFPHFLEWNMMDGLITKFAMFDMDGVLCPNIPSFIDADEDRYIEYIEKIEPYKNNIPHKTPCYAICTGRLEKYRDVTEKWLNRHGVKYNKLIMYPYDKKTRDKNHSYNVGMYKAKNFSDYDCRFFIESCEDQSKIIKKTIKDKTKIVICNTTKRVY